MYTEFEGDECEYDANMTMVRRLRGGVLNTEFIKL